jgi:hypothetical protein
MVQKDPLLVPPGPPGGWLGNLPPPRALGVPGLVSELGVCFFFQPINFRIVFQGPAPAELRSGPAEVVLRSSSLMARLRSGHLVPQGFVPDPLYFGIAEVVLLS